MNLIHAIQNEISNAYKVALILDEWTTNNISFIGISAFLTGDNIKNDSITLALSVPDNLERTANTISRELSSQMLHSYLKDKIIGTVTDCAAVMKKSMDIINLEWSPCLSHILHNGIKKCCLQYLLLQQL